MTRRSLRSLLLRAERELRVAAARTTAPKRGHAIRCIILARELRDAAIKGIRA